MALQIYPYCKKPKITLPHPDETGKKSTFIINWKPKMEIPEAIPQEYMQSFNNMAKAIIHVFTYLNVKDLVVASRVCISWNMISNNEVLWRSVSLKNVMVYDWHKFMETIIRQGSTALNSRSMLVPYRLHDFDKFWINFTIAIKKATKLYELELYKCPINVVHECILTLPQLTILIASTIKNPNARKDAKYGNSFKSIKLNYVNHMVNLTKLRLKAQTGIQLEPLPVLTFVNLTKLHTLSLTSIKSFPKDICKSLEPVTATLVHFEIGDCAFISKDLPLLIEKFSNLKLLRLENCSGDWDEFAKEVFVAIRSLKNLRILELVNIEFISNVEEGLEQCTGLDSLLIIPRYVNQSATVSRHLIDCLRNLTKTLKYLVWGLTDELLRVTDLFITQYLENQQNLSYTIDVSQTKDPSNNIPILRARRPTNQSEDDNDNLSNVEIITIPALQQLLEEMMVNTKIKLIKVAFVETTRVYIQEY